jgi:hypothetical protein
MISVELSMSMVCNEASLVPDLKTLSIAKFTFCTWKLCEECHEETKVFGEKLSNCQFFQQKYQNNFSVTKARRPHYETGVKKIIQIKKNVKVKCHRTSTNCPVHQTPCNTTILQSTSDSSTSFKKIVVGDIGRDNWAVHFTRQRLKRAQTSISEPNRRPERTQDRRTKYETSIAMHNKVQTTGRRNLGRMSKKWI